MWNSRSADVNTVFMSTGANFTATLVQKVLIAGDLKLGSF